MIYHLTLRKKRRKYILNRHEKQMEYKEHVRILERIALEMTPLKMSTSAKILRKNAKKFLIKGVVRKNQVQDESWKDEVIIISVGVDMKNMQSWKIFAYRDHASSFTWNGWWHEIEEKKSWILTIFLAENSMLTLHPLKKKKNKEKNVKGFFFPVTENVETSA